MSDDSNVDDSNVADRNTGVWHARKALLVITMAISLLGLAGIGTTAIIIIQQRQYVDCQRAYNTEVVKVLKERGEASNDDRTAIRLIAQSGASMLDVLLRQPPASREVQLKALSDWRDAQSTADTKLKDADNTRLANPLPEPRMC
jgi:homoserine dehydrogenase